jgi:DNA-directed RNA polymerase alpha subunit
MAGIDQVLFTQNTSPIPDEMLAHRLGMVPLISQKVMDGLRYTRVSLFFSIHLYMSFPSSLLPKQGSSLLA